MDGIRWCSGGVSTLGTLVFGKMDEFLKEGGGGGYYSPFQAMFVCCTSFVQFFFFWGGGALVLNLSKNLGSVLYISKRLPKNLGTLVGVHPSQSFLQHLVRFPNLLLIKVKNLIRPQPAQVI